MKKKESKGERKKKTEKKQLKGTKEKYKKVRVSKKESTSNDWHRNSLHIG